MARYINPYTDFGFKKLFGEEGNKDLLIDFLNQLLPPHHQIADLNFRNPENLADFSTERKAIFDIHCKALSGEKFIVEMQKAKVKYFKDRSLFYITFPIREQAQQGDWNFRLEPIYFVAILDFEYDEAEEIRKFRRDVSLKDQDGDIFFDKLHFKFLQMPLFNKKENELATKFDKWCYFLKNLESFDQIPNILNEPIFQKAFGTAELANLSIEQRAIYEENLIQYWGMKSALETAVEEREIEIAKNLILLGSENEFIAKATNLSIEQIKQLRNEIKKN
ncbi:Rpn family recombination-promoting nuclease/putative transposase [Arcicella rigui]|uniref:Rpn family recombination-promoting nuclease/putative transposase n=1 Tax=Arcicella rigui TaxID=797020 RepID=A0ABU5QCK3_9BACT|nr:Rpn family recombination-promoting nuclease/putative transposase [Arcicella rigui]MEA5140580.1 Rpn family recombination-promoting nuclease/putative transposase [Arcicella rigui]